MNSLRLIKSVKPVQVTPVTDVRLNDLTSKLNLNFDLIKIADADPAEIIARQEICRWLLDNPNILGTEFFCGKKTNKLIPDQSVVAAETDEKIPIKKLAPEELVKIPTATLPKETSQFLLYCKQLKLKATRFWKRQTNFEESLDSLYCLPPRVAAISHHMDREGKIKYGEEVDLADEIMTELRKTLAVSGVVRFFVEARYGENSSCRVIDPSKLEYTQLPRYIPRRNKDFGCYGAWPYHPKLDPNYDPTMNYLQKSFSETFVIGRMIKWYLRKRHELGAGKVYINRTPGCIAADIALHLRSLFSDPKTPAEAFDVFVSYSFSDAGLKIKLMDWKLANSKSYREGELAIPEFGVSVHSRLYSRMVKRREKLDSSRANKRSQSVLNAWFLKNHQVVEIDAPYTCERFCSPRFDEVLAQYRNRIVQILDWQGKIDAAMDDMLMLKKLTYRVNGLGVETCFPKINQEQTVTANNLRPMRLTPKEGKKIRPFSDISFNGKIVNLTGRNNSGKSTLMLSVLDLQIMGQCGIPVFAKDASISPRSKIVLSFLDRDSDQSTFAAKVVKDMNIMEEILKMKPEDLEEVQVIIDEMGSATDQGGVMQVATPLIDWLYKHGVSVIMSTQIPELSEYLESTKQGYNFRFNKNYQLEPGIGYAEPVEVAKDLGYFELLKQSVV